ncbi:SGNH/GDSL hydrolase family protein [Dactylosporangium matsuzakiense]|uniref:Lipase n=1 Tax=Dactylosporangium matsuzakiense TaxID=53360 RepID=A0A9W6NKQ3_9ACTN|nr:SGNH/GDSL hydrolase family protein [Dactylosporangium matsuzakiense]UWZ42557.1 SGNH/GDSL hydrolase family protein [Dactylosporangium matsuzakiense]GLL00524.1 lipase [Dactylosporangium matsuzakiense]
MIFGPGQRVLFIGDSITDAGRTGPLPPYGDGYFNLLRALVTARHPDLDLTWLNRGIGGDTVRHLRERWQRDALDERPDWLSVMIGINDVWRAFGDRPHEAVPLPEFETTLRALLAEAVESTGCRLIVATPYLIEPDRSDPQRAQSDSYAAVVRRVATDHGALLVDTQATFDRLLTHRPPSAWAPDRVHPGLEGHTALALAFLDVVEG